MRDFDTLTFHPTTEKIVQILCRKTQNDNPEFFRVLLSYYLAKVAATMRIKIATKDRGEIPVNLYAVNLATSGHGKGHSTNIIEEQIIHLFRERFFSTTYPAITDVSLGKLARQRAIIKDVEEEVMRQAVQEEFDNLGKLAFSFDSASGGPAIKQLRQKLLMGDAGSINMEIDEIGSNITGNVEALTTFLELFDVGKAKQKLIKNTKENTRSEEIEGRTPANLLMFGTPSKLFDGGQTEDLFYSLLETGYARRCLFGFSKSAKKNRKMSAEDIYNALTDPNVSTYLADVARHLESLADISYHNKRIGVSKDVSILGIKYKMYCEDLVEQMGEHEDIAKAEMAHRYFKALKLAGVYAFIDGSSEITEDHYYHAICMVEESGRAFKNILTRDRSYVKLAKYISTIGREVTLVDLGESLPFFKGSGAHKQELLQLASAWGYKNQVVIKRTLTGGVEFFTGEALKPVNLQKLRVAYSSDIADGYDNALAPWNTLHNMTQHPGLHWINHHTLTGHRSEDKLVEGFDLIVLDVDEGATLEECHLLLKDYKFMTYTTKRHTDNSHRFRLIMPMNYHLKMKPAEYRDFMANVFEWLPIQVDTQTSQRSRKWMSHDAGQFYYSQGEQLIDVRPFIPKTHQNDERHKFMQTVQSLTGFERWFIQTSKTGNRNNQLARYALALVDMGRDISYIREAVYELNDKIEDGLSTKEIDATILRSAAQKIQKLATKE